MKPWLQCCGAQSPKPLNMPPNNPMRPIQTPNANGWMLPQIKSTSKQQFPALDEALGKAWGMG